MCEYSRPILDLTRIEEKRARYIIFLVTLGILKTNDIIELITNSSLVCVNDVGYKVAYF